MFSMAPVERLSSTVTWWPAPSSASARCDPMNPAPPVMKAFTCVQVLGKKSPSCAPTVCRRISRSYSRARTRSRLARRVAGQGYQKRPAGSDDARDAHLGQTVGRVPLTAFWGQADAIARTAGQVDAHDAAAARPAARSATASTARTRPARACRRRPPGASARCRRSAAARHCCSMAAEHRPGRWLPARAGSARRARPGATPSRSTTASSPGAPVRTTEAPMSVASTRCRVGESLDRPLLDRAAAGRVDGQQRPSGAAGRRQAAPAPRGQPRAPRPERRAARAARRPSVVGTRAATPRAGRRRARPAQGRCRRRVGRRRTRRRR